jgi:hypothetical protein
MTIATMGRLMKNLDMFLTPFRRWLLCLNVDLEWLGLYGHSRFEVLLAFNDHSFAGFQAVSDHPHCACAFANLNRSNRDLAVVSDNVNDIAALLLVDGSLRNQ